MNLHVTARSRAVLCSASLTLVALFASLLVQPLQAEAQGQPDLFVVLATGESVGSTAGAGAVALLAVNTAGSTAGSALIHQGSVGVPGANEAGDGFASSAAWGDVDGNGIDDLIVGAAGEDIGSIVGAGAITVLYDAATGSFTSSSVFHQGSPGVPGRNEVGDAWGTSVASGDLNGDGYDDVIVGAPQEDIGSHANTGAITVLFGSPSGLSGRNADLFHQDSPGVPGANEAGDGFGLSVAIAGRQTGSSMYAAVGSPFEDVNGAADAGAVTLFGTDSSGLVAAGPLLYAGAAASGVRPQMPTTLFANDKLGFRLDGHPNGTLVIGAPFGDVYGLADAGYVLLYEGFYRTPAAHSIFQDVATSVERGNLFGSAIDIEVVGGVSTVAVGASGDAVDGQAKAGSVTVIPASGQATTWTQNSNNVPSVAEFGDSFGSYVDLLPSGAMFVGSPGEDIGSKNNTGAGTVFFGTPTRPGRTAIVSVHQDTSGVPGFNESHDQWGMSGASALKIPTALPPVVTPPSPPKPNPPAPTATPKPNPPAPTPKPKPPAPTPTPRPNPPAPTPTPAPPAPPASEIAPSNGAHVGANVSKGTHSTRYAAIEALERKLGRQLSIINRFHEFSAGLTSSFHYDRLHIRDGRTVMISWRATDNPGSVNGEPDRYRARKIVQGRFDAQIEAMARALRDFDAPVLLRFNWEMDQNVGDAQHIGTPAEFKAAWRYVHRKFKQLGADNVEWVWAPRARSFAKDVGPTFYPGDAYVDWIGGSAVPLSSFTDAETIYSDWNDWASAKNKPQLIWIGLRENPDNSRWKGNFIDELHTLIEGPWDGVKALVYYHADSPKGYDYWIDTSTRSLREFRELACDPYFETTDSC